MTAALGMGVAPPGTVQQRPAFRGTVDRVRVDVIVVDRDGRFVDDLAPTRFRLFEDGVAQQILSVELVAGTLETARESNQEPITVAATSAARDAVGVAPGAPGERTVAGATGPGAIVYLIDIRRLEPKGMARFIRAFREQFSVNERLSTPRAAYLIDRNGWFREIASLTLAPSVLERAAEELGRQPKYGLPFEGPASVGGSLPSSVVTEYGVLELITQFASSLGYLRGRKALVWVSGGFPSGAPPFDNRPGLKSRLERLARTANSANLSIYAIDPTRRVDMKGSFYKGAFDVSNRFALGTGRSMGDELSAESMRNGLVYAAKATGGLSYLSWSDVDRALESIGRDTGSYYLLTYEPPSRIGDGRYHDIRVEVLDPSLQVRYRRGYVDYREGERRERRLAGALAAPGITPGFSLSVGSVGAAQVDGRSLATIEIVGEVPVGARPDARGDLAFVMSAMAVPEDRSRVIRARHWLRWRDVELLPDGGVASTRPRFRLEHAWPLGPGRYEVRIALYQPLTQDVAVTRAHICVEAAESPADEGALYSVGRCAE